MNNEEIIEKLTLGKDLTETVTIDGVDITLRPLTSGELSKLKTIDKKGLTMKVGVSGNTKKQSVAANDIDVNAAELSKYQTEAMYTAVAWSMDISKEAVENFAVGIPEKIFMEVSRISNLQDTDLTILKQFRKNE